MEEVILHFLKTHCDWSRPVLIGLSGGPDSIALLHLLLRCAQSLPLKLGIAHIDHRWRPESEEEACLLKNLAESFHLPFHLKVLDPMPMRGNWEELCRHWRYQFFTELAKVYGYQAVVLGHHQDDQAETLLKRILEGASLVKLGGMQKEKVHGDLVVWRPLLGIDKTKILGWLSKRDIPFFVDRTNLDPTFLRGKMRSSILPYLSKEFGKEIKSALLHLGQESEELQSFLEGHLRPYLEKIRRTPLGVWIDLSKDFPPTSFELKQLLRYILKGEGIGFSRAQIKLAENLIKEKRANCCLEVGHCQVQFDRGSIFVEKKNGGSWKAAWELIRLPLEDIKGPNWRDVWQGKFSAIVPWEEDYRLDLPLSAQGGWLNKWWTAHKVPAFFRWKFPVVWQNNRIVHEFLSGKMKLKRDKIKKWAKVTLEYSM
ncbi:tRNA lysidine(34) synthetase TilS [Parachlamydia sp. AcF125]|uniref:tRNA lysidine(34) synthetase TilS n=1 Tax=Parachlamydia sp. AcF125 TaxID=2795736 RepID=UPI001BCA04A4|nr:tRNA lysidine(34) synthetase TilS [Parachlamydia sp. AcF125]MBS4167502.1 tRNA(Ile)-lysidine synthase [Parachlamydia sp. AcF125]